MVAAKIAAAVDEIRNRNRIRDRRRERSRRGTPHFEDFKDAHQKVLRTQVLAVVAKEREQEKEDEERRREDEERRRDEEERRRDDDRGDDGYRRDRYSSRDDGRAYRPDDTRSDDRARSHYGPGRGSGRDDARRARFADDEARPARRGTRDRSPDRYHDDGRNVRRGVLYVTRAASFPMSGSNMIPLPVAIAHKMPHIVHEFGRDSVREFVAPVPH